jgi:hypothetical protein
MTGSVAAGLGAIAFAAATGGMAVAQWTGRLGRGRDPDALTERLYLLTPLATMFLLVGLLLLLEGLGVPVPDALAGAVLVLGLGLGLLGVALLLLQPRRLRPAWQKRQIQGHAARRRQGGDGGAYAIDLVRLRQPVREPDRYPTVEAALAAAEEALRTGGGEYATVVDTRSGVGVRVVEPPLDG